MNISPKYKGRKNPNFVPPPTVKSDDKYIMKVVNKMQLYTLLGNMDSQIKLKIINLYNKIIYNGKVCDLIINKYLPDTDVLYIGIDENYKTILIETSITE